MRQFYFKYGITPMVRLLMKNMRDELGASKGSNEYLYKLFPGGPSRQGSRIAGLPEPQGCID
jgi:tRNA 2-thiouridine synthesizing protein E